MKAAMRIEMKIILKAMVVVLMSAGVVSGIGSEAGAATKMVTDPTVVTKASWGNTAFGDTVDIYTLRNAEVTAQVTTYGARLVSVRTADKTGKVADVVLGYDNLAAYLADNKTHFGGVVGRYGNRIAKGKFSIDGHDYQIPPNNNGNALHGGPVGFDVLLWTATQVPDGVEMTLVSPDGDMGFPGTLTATVKYTLHGRALRLDYSAKSDKPTVVNLTNHAYFNLHGDDVGTVLDQKLTLNAERYTPVDAGLIPTGELALVAGTPLDFRKSTVIGERINADNAQLKLAGGYDFNWVLNGGKAGELHEAAKVVDPVSGRTLTVTTTEPGVQFYTGNFLDGTFTVRAGVVYSQHKGFCLETQHFPDSPNHENFPSTLLKPGVVRHSTTVFTFGVE